MKVESTVQYGKRPTSGTSRVRAKHMFITVDSYFAATIAVSFPIWKSCFATLFRLLGNT